MNAESLLSSSTKAGAMAFAVRIDVNDGPSGGLANSPVAMLEQFGQGGNGSRAHLSQGVAALAESPILVLGASHRAGRPRTAFPTRQRPHREPANLVAQQPYSVAVVASGLARVISPRRGRRPLNLRILVAEQVP